VARVVDETAGDGNGRWNGGDSDVNSTTSSGNVDLTQVEAVLLATDSQQMCSCQITRKYDLPVSFWPPIQPADQPYGPARCQHRCGRFKIEQINDKKNRQPNVKWRNGLPEMRSDHAATWGRPTTFL